MTATVGRARTRTRVRPTEASTATSAARIAVPRRRTTAPWRTSSPRAQMWRPGAAAFKTRTRGPAGSVCSTIAIASAPSGTGAPVMIREHCPGPIVRDGARPAGISSMISSSPGVSCARTANPSIDDLSNGGMSRSEATSSARAHPSASDSARVSSRGGGTRRMIASAACGSVSIVVGLHVTWSNA
jgi:hypothetical protein